MYLVSATLTRPTPLCPISSCHHKVKFTDDIDVSYVEPPKPRASMLLPGRRKPKGASTKAPTISFQDNASHEGPGMLDDPLNEMPSDEPCSVDPPYSPTLSEVSANTGSSSSRSWHLATSASTKIGQVDTSAIHAVLELSQGGCLPGDRVPIQISVKHVKPIKNMHGIIVTLYRTCRVDTHPTLPLGPVKQGSKVEYEDYYPRSKTGLGGLSLSSPGSHKTFRQDLNQIFEPMIIDPNTLTTQVKAHIKIPDDIFPSITSVPGSMINFRYEVEVVVDLRGKLAGQDYIRSQIGMISVPRGYGLGDPKKHGVDGSTGLVFPLASGFGCLDTTQIRREKFVIARAFELVVGTRDSERMRLRKLGKQAARSPAQSPLPTPTSERHPPVDTTIGGPPSFCSDVYQREDYFPGVDPAVSQYNDGQIPPSAPDSRAVLDDGLDEKTRLRNAEARLLPSAPPVDDSPSTSHPSQLLPTAPPLSGDLGYTDQFESLHGQLPQSSDQSLGTTVPAYSSTGGQMAGTTPPIGVSGSFHLDTEEQIIETRCLDQQSPTMYSHDNETSCPITNPESSMVDDGISSSNGNGTSLGPPGAVGIFHEHRPIQHPADLISMPSQDDIQPDPLHTDHRLPTSTITDDPYEAHPTSDSATSENLPQYQR